MRYVHKPKKRNSLSWIANCVPGLIIFLLLDIYIIGEIMSFEKSIKEIVIELSPNGESIGAFIHAKQRGNLLFMSGEVAFKDGIRPKGDLGADMSLDVGYQHARQVGMLLSSAMNSVLG